jgi:hypothetical protein
MKKCILLCTVGVMVVFIRGQSLTQTVIATTGGDQYSTSGSVSFTSGETITPTFSNGVHILTQGFQQPYKDLAASVEETPSWTALAFPNPADYMLNVTIQNSSAKEFNWEIIDLKGSTLLQSSNPVFVDGSLTLEIAVDQLAPSTYFLRIHEPVAKPYIIKFIKK